MGGRYDIMQRIKEVLEASDPLKYGDAERSRTVEVGPAPELSPDPRLAEYAAPPATPVPPPPATVPPPPVAAEQGEVLALLRDGHKIMAVKRYRELTGASLAEAKAAVDALEQGHDAPPATAAPDMAALAARVAALVRGGNTIEAIRVYREAANVGLREAKEAVEAIAANQRQAPPPPPPASAPPAPVPAWLAPVVDRLRRGDKIGAIKAYRDATAVGLAEAKASVEALERQLGGQRGG